MVNMVLSQTLFPRHAMRQCCCCFSNPFFQFGVQGEVAGDSGAYVSEVIHHLGSVDASRDAFDAADVLAKDVGLLKTDGETIPTKSLCDTADETL